MATKSDVKTGLSKGKTGVLKCRVSPVEMEHYLSALSDGETISGLIRDALDREVKKRSRRSKGKKAGSKVDVREVILKGKDSGRSWAEITREVNSLGGKIYSVHEVKDLYKSK